MGKGVFLKSRASIRGVQPLHLRRGDHLVPVLDSYQLINVKRAKKHLGPLWFIECGKQFAIILRSSDVQKSTIYYINASAGNIKPNVEWKYNMTEQLLYLRVLEVIEPGSQLFVRYDPDHDIFHSTPTRK